MPQHATATRRFAVDHARAALAAEVRGDSGTAIARWTSAASADPAWSQAHAGLGQALLRAGRAADACVALERALALAPGEAGVWLALAAARLETGNHPQALAASERAVALAPRSGPIHVGRGDILRAAGRTDEALASYRLSVQCAPEDAEALNKLGTAERNAWRLSAARTAYDRGLAVAPRHPLLRVNRAVLDVLMGRSDHSRARLVDALGDRTLPEDARQSAEATLRWIDEESALDAPLQAGLREGDPTPVARALQAVDTASGAALAIDAPLIAELEALVVNVPDAPELPRFDPTDTRWPRIEAQGNFRLGDDVDAIVASVTGTQVLTGVSHEDVERYEALVRWRRAHPLPVGSGVAAEAWLRHVHAAATRHRPECLPGRLKATANDVAVDPRPRRTPPQCVSGTTRVALGDLADRLPPGSIRAAFVHFAIAEIHPFQEANGRIARLAANAVLEAAGSHPFVLPRARYDAQAPSIFGETRRQRSLAPFVEWIAQGSRHAAELARRVAQRASAG